MISLRMPSSNLIAIATDLKSFILKLDIDSKQISASNKLKRDVNGRVTKIRLSAKGFLFFIFCLMCASKSLLVLEFSLNFTFFRYSIKASEVMDLHVISYELEKDLVPIILSNCQYSLESGKETLQEFDFPKIQHQLTTRLFQGKPLITMVVCALLLL